MNTEITITLKVDDDTYHVPQEDICGYCEWEFLPMKVSGRDVCEACNGLDQFKLNKAVIKRKKEHMKR